MSTNFYNHGLEAFLTGQINYASDNIAAVLLDLTKYTANLTTDQHLSDIPSLAQVSISPYMTGKTTTGGVAGATSPYTFPTPTGNPCGAVAYYKDTGTASTSPLICYVDSATAGLPATPNGSNISIVVPYLFEL